MTRIELNRDEDGFEVAEIDGDTVTFRIFDIFEDYPAGIEGCTWSMPLADVLRVAEVALAAK